MITPQKSQKTNREPNLNLLGCSQFDLNLFREGLIQKCFPGIRVSSEIWIKEYGSNVTKIF